MTRKLACLPHDSHNADQAGARDDPFFFRLREEAQAAATRERTLAPWLEKTILAAPDLEAAIAQRLGERLHHEAVAGALIKSAYLEAATKDAFLGLALRADLEAVLERDPAANRLLEPMLYFKGFHALEAHRMAAFFWHHNGRDFALYLQSRISEAFQVDIHPAARLGKGIFIDHATGVTIGSTAVIEDDVSILQGVTLGGTGKERGDRHPKIGHGVLIGAGASVLGNIKIGDGARIAAGSVVLRPVPACKTVAGVPAKIIGDSGCLEPARAMDQTLGALIGPDFDVGL